MGLINQNKTKQPSSIMNRNIVGVGGCNFKYWISIDFIEKVKLKQRHKGCEVVNR